MYYLKSRYYDPEVCRFINADKLASTGQGILGSNMFAYCLNNPVNGVDPSGHFPSLGDIWDSFRRFLDGAFGAESTESNSEEHIYPNELFPITVSCGTTVSTTQGDSDKPVVFFCDVGTDFVKSSVGVRINFSLLYRDYLFEVSLGLNDTGIKVGYKDGKTTSCIGARADLSRLRAGVESSITYEERYGSRTAFNNISVNFLFLLYLVYFFETGEVPPELYPA